MPLLWLAGGGAGEQLCVCVILGPWFAEEEKHPVGGFGFEDGEALSRGSFEVNSE